MVEKLFLNGYIPENCYILHNEKDCYIIDPGYQKEIISKFVEKNKWYVKGILLTHGHFDHVGAIDCFDVPVYIYEKDFKMLMNCENHVSGFGQKLAFNINDINIKSFSKDEKIILGEKEIEIILTPGHTEGSVSYKFENDIVVGDTIFMGSVGRWDLPSGNQKQLSESVIKILEEFDATCSLYPGHGEVTMIRTEKLINDSYKYWKKGNLFPY